VSLRRALGEAAYAGDLSLPGTLHLAVRRSPHAHARVVRADPAPARVLPGVAAVLTAEDAPGLLDPVLRFVGDRAAVAAAEEPELARRAAEMVALELEPLPAVVDPETALTDEGRIAARLEAGEGDTDRALAEAERLIEGTWQLPSAPVFSLEPVLALTWLDEDRRLVVRSSAESPFRIRGLLADRLGLPAARIRVVRPLVAGGAGARSSVLVEDLCALVTLRTGRPARLGLSAEEAMTTTPGRPAQRVQVRLALRDGRIHALVVRLLVDLGAGTEDAVALLRAAGRHALGIYRVPALRFEAVAVRTNRPPAGAVRGAEDAAAVAVECAIDEAAALLEEDPAAFRRRHLRGPGDAGANTLMALGEQAGADDSRPLGELLRVGAREGSWPRRWRAFPASIFPRRGFGVGLARRAAGTIAGASAAASLRLLDDGSFTLAAGPSSAGGTDESVFAEAAAAILGVSARRVVTAAVDTDSAPFEAGDPAPTFFATGRAVEDAAHLALEQIREAGARRLGVAPAQVAVADGRLRTADGRELDYAQIGAEALRAGQPLSVTAAPTAASAPPTHSAVFAEVEVDAETGLVRVLSLSAWLAGGPFADPRPAEGQVEGALAAALEQALAAGLPFDSEGRPLLRSPTHWPLIAAVDMPSLTVTYLPTGEPLSRFGAAAVGEAAGRAALAAIANAVALAAGGRVRTFPLTPARVRAALSGA
jgi:putative selenate reductase molybdopterin-binding subunit